LWREPRWAALIRAFYVQHRCRNPLFRDIPREFVHRLLQPLSERPTCTRRRCQPTAAKIRSSDFSPAQSLAFGAASD